jgi:8-oxo-dGTP diphosphatase
MKLSTLCYIRQNNKTLMMHRIKKENDMHKGKWNGLGGKFEE